MAPPEVVSTAPCPLVLAFKERPILFTGPMVRALLDGTKTQTRRVVKPQPWATARSAHYSPATADGEHPASVTFSAMSTYDPPWACLRPVPCPYGEPGDRLWVKETFFAWGRWETRYSAKKRRNEWHFIDMTVECGESYLYAADGVCDTQAFVKRRGDARPMYWKRPAIFMPRAVSRIDLEETGVRVERLQDISRADARAEGAPPSHPSIDRVSREFGYADFPRSWYAQLWDEINGPGSWAANPWLWVVEFKRAAVGAAQARGDV
jgi:hypothetical protein